MKNIFHYFKVLSVLSLVFLTAACHKNPDFEEGYYQYSSNDLDFTHHYPVDNPTDDPADNPDDGYPSSCPATVTDVDGNTYNTVQIGNQCWMRENLRTTKYSDGTAIALGSSTSSDIAYRYNPDNNAGNVSAYGYLYNWKAVMRNSSSSSANPSGVQGVCPAGWHVPSNAEWTQLTDYVSSQSQYQCGGTSTNIAKALASATGWSSSSATCAVGNNPSGNNATGFSALPAGRYLGVYPNVGNNANFWSSTEGSNDAAYTRTLYSSIEYVYSANNNKYYGYSVRCLKD
jgi:uncharacterized protein (TIGR02145 family)